MLALSLDRMTLMTSTNLGQPSAFLPTRGELLAVFLAVALLLCHGVLWGLHFCSGLADGPGSEVSS